MGRETDAIGFLTDLSDAPYRHDFYQTLRRIECLYADKPRWGQGRKASDDPIRLGQAPDLAFAPAPLAAFIGAKGSAPARLLVHLFGLMGPNGPLPLHITEYARERLHHAGDATLVGFLDVLNHRFLALLYRAWAQAQPHVNHDRPADDRFATYVGAFIGTAMPAARDRDAVSDLAKWFRAGTLIRQTRNADGLQVLLEDYFQVPVRIEEFVGHWMVLGAGERTWLGRDGAQLGGGAVLGGQVWDRQHKFRVHLGPLSLSQYESFLPGGASTAQLVDWVRLYLAFELEWEVRMLLRENEVPPAVLGRTGRLGWTTWLGARRDSTDAGDLCLDAEAFVSGIGVRAA
jgi:type VI secretion system protein ImpH